MLFVCEFNSARSQAAEALARHWAARHGAGLRPLSAGLQATVVNELVCDGLRGRGISVHGLASKALEDVLGTPLDRAVVLAEPAASRVAELMPHVRAEAWFMPDPIRARGDDGTVGEPRAVRAAVERMLDDLDARVQALVLEYAS